MEEERNRCGSTLKWVTLREEEFSADAEESVRLLSVRYDAVNGAIAVLPESMDGAVAVAIPNSSKRAWWVRIGFVVDAVDRTSGALYDGLRATFAYVTYERVKTTGIAELNTAPASLFELNCETHFRPAPIAGRRLIFLNPDWHRPELSENFRPGAFFSGIKIHLGRLVSIRGQVHQLVADSINFRKNERGSAAGPLCWPSRVRWNEKRSRLERYYLRQIAIAICVERTTNR